jgi:hypothetical protein
MGGGGGGGGGLMGGRIIYWRQLEKATRNGRGEVGRAGAHPTPFTSVLANGPLLCASGLGDSGTSSPLHRPAPSTHAGKTGAQLTYPLLPGPCVLSCKAKTGR